ncbi:tryptophan 2-monooxygenase, partial [Pectobacterium versatile]|nr:tryptophan 2-monooxygenase [Pectobacterium versatile]
YYLDKLGIATTTSFPDPGVVDTELHYRGVRHIWSAGDPPPSLFSRVHEGWLALLNEGYLHNGVLLAAPKDITAMLKSHCFDKARKAWQAWLDAFRDCSFYSALVVMFTSNTPPGGVP